MSRLTDPVYLQNREQLRAARARDNMAFILLNSIEQWDLFRYYLPHERLSREELLTHRAEISRLDSSLPQRAGRALHRFHRLEARLPVCRERAAIRPRPKKNVKKHVALFSEVTPSVDAQRIAKILLDAALADYRAENSGTPSKMDSFNHHGD